VKGLLARKRGMTQIFDDRGIAVPVTVLEAGPCVVVGLRTADRDGYAATQLGFDEVAEKKLTKPKLGQLKKAGVKPMRTVHEFRGEPAAGLEVGAELKADVFAEGDKVAVVATSKGKGFAGVVKRHRFGRGPVTHGSHNIRQPGSVGSVDAARTWKGLKLPGQMGNVRVTTRGLTIVKVDLERNLLMIRGAVPGPKNALVVVREQREGDATGPATGVVDKPAAPEAEAAPVEAPETETQAPEAPEAQAAETAAAEETPVADETPAEGTE
jgi:large subunit ribosomal protein L3